MKTNDFPFSRVLQLLTMTIVGSLVMLLSACEGRQEKLGEQVDEAAEDIQEAHDKITEGEEDLIEAKQELVDAKVEAEAGLEAPAPTPDAEPEVTSTPIPTPESAMTQMPAATPVGDFPPTPEPNRVE